MYKTHHYKIINNKSEKYQAAPKKPTSFIYLQPLKKFTGSQASYRSAQRTPVARSAVIPRTPLVARLGAGIAASLTRSGTQQ